MKEEKTAVTAKAVTKFTKEQLLSAKKFFNRKDALGAVLKDNESYSMEEAERLLGDFMKGQVK